MTTYTPALDRIQSALQRLELVVGRVGANSESVDLLGQCRECGQGVGQRVIRHGDSSSSVAPTSPLDSAASPAAGTAGAPEASGAPDPSPGSGAPNGGAR